MTIRWYGLVAPEEVPTGDRRMIAAQALSFRDFPLPAMWQRASTGGHDNSVVVASWDRAYAAQGGVWAEGSFLDPTVVPEVIEVLYLLEKKLIGPSVDLDYDLEYEVVDHPEQDGQNVLKITKARCHGVTFVMAPAFPQVHITVDDEGEHALLASAGISSTFAVNNSGWRKLPIASRETPFDADDAIQRIAQWSGGDAGKFGGLFLYRNPQGPPNNRETYRLPYADIVNNKPILVPRAIMSAATILSGAHGNLPTVPDEEKISLQKIVTEIYDHLNETYQDPRFKPPWQVGGREGATSSDDTPNPQAAQEGTVTAASDIPVAPDRSVFDNPNLKRPTSTKVDGHRVYGHLASWKTCHLAVRDKCVMAPKSITNYRLAKTGDVLCADGTLLKVGKLTVGTGHADLNFGVVAASEHYDHTGTCVAIVNYGEDKHGIWFAGSLVAEATEEQIAQLRRSPLSGDWRRVNGNLELCAALAVNNPGFPIVGEDEDGSFSLTAAGVVFVDDEEVTPERDFSVLSAVDEFLASQDRERRRLAFAATALEGECNCEG